MPQGQDVKAIATIAGIVACSIGAGWLNSTR